MSSFRLDKEQVRVAIVGAGVGGLAAAIAMKRQLKFENFIIYDKASDMGGTWQANTYPGCASDVGGHWYSLSTDLNPYWERYYATQPELHAYWTSLVDKYALRPHAVLSTRVVAAEWDDVSKTYAVRLRSDGDGGSGREWTEVVEVLIDATGSLEKPAFPPAAILPGRETFKGVQFHSARWRHDVQLAGKRVCVVGNGCSAAQFVPLISEDPTVEITNFIRTPSWFIPRNNFAFPEWKKWVFANVPLALRLYRNYVAFSYDINFVWFRPWGEPIRSAVQKRLEKNIREIVPAEYADKLVPNYPMGCKRAIYDPGYLKSMNRPNVTLNFDGIDAVVPEGIRTKKGEIIPFDVIIWGTGFDVLNVAVDVRGNNGKLLSEFYKSQGGPTAYLGTTAPGFPNMFTLMGPNTVTGHASVIFSEESQINYMFQLLKPIIDRKVRTFEVRRSASDAYNTMIQKRVEGTVWTRCSSWYRAPAAEDVAEKGTAPGPGKGKAVGIFPGPLWLFWWWTRSPRWSDYIATGAERWERERARRKALNVVGALLFLGFAAGMAQPPFRQFVFLALEELLGSARKFLAL